MGKTFFSQSWKKSLEGRNIPVIEFDAWKNDYLESPLVGFISTLQDQLPEGDKHRTARQKVSNFAKSAAPIILKSGVRIGARILTLGAIDGDIDKIKEIVVDEGVTRIDELSEISIRAFKTALSQRDFHEDLQRRFLEVVSEVRSLHDNNSLFILIDELDRCRPDFALTLLEDIKHFLGVEGVKFFIFCDEDVLEAQAHKVMGTRRAGEKYASKFYRQRLRLPAGNRKDFALSYLQELSLENEIRDWAPGNTRAEHISSLIQQTNISLREIKKTLEYAVSVSILSEWVRRSWPIANALLVLRASDPQAYNEFRETGTTSKTFFLNQGEDTDPLNLALIELLKMTEFDRKDTNDGIKKVPSYDPGLLDSLLRDLGSGPIDFRPAA